MNPASARPAAAAPMRCAEQPAIHITPTWMGANSTSWVAASSKWDASPPHLQPPAAIDWVATVFGLSSGFESSSWFSNWNKKEWVGRDDVEEMVAKVMEHVFSDYMMVSTVRMDLGLTLSGRLTNRSENLLRTWLVIYVYLVTWFTRLGY